MKIQQGSVYFNEVNKPQFNGQYESIVKFDMPYKMPPFVMVSVTRLDTTSFVREFPYPVISPKGEEQTGFKDAVLRYDCEAVEVTNTGFKIKAFTWASNIIYAMRVSWISFGE